MLGIRSAAKSCLANSLRCSCPAVATSCTSVTVPGSLEYSRLQRDLPELRLTSQPRRVFASYNPGCRLTSFKTSRSKPCLQYLTINPLLSVLNPSRPSGPVPVQSRSEILRPNKVQFRLGTIAPFQYLYLCGSPGPVPVQSRCKAHHFVRVQFRLGTSSVPAPVS
ncbi:hypothetical protein SKAU_G00064660 [Synaphobranchus kaupii]|uniref:Uncharacterized protein n=1 Tax=Synaphobranchus kaupii TaxID=118154 RepID=A0A9Q1J9Y3_SYNKA|nr:hypothetical protein SKAU_G00064660 [Synaphobranchus kaupii]